MPTHEEDPLDGRTSAPDAATQVAAELAESLGDVVYAFRVAPDFAFEYISPGVEQLTGYTPAEYYADASIAITHTPEDQAATIPAADAAEPGTVTSFTVQWVRRDGVAIWTQHRARMEQRPDGALVMHAAARDVTAQVEAEHALATSQEMYRLLAIAKYGDRYVIPKAHAETARELEELACAVDYEGVPATVSGPFGEASGRPVPVAVETFHAL